MPDDTKADEGDPAVTGPAPGPVFRHLQDRDLTWQQVKSVRRTDGSVASGVGEMARLLRPTPPTSPSTPAGTPGWWSRRHGRLSPARALRAVGLDALRRPAVPGRHPHRAPAEHAFGPFVAETEGTVTLEVMMGDPRWWGDEPGGLHRRAATHRGRGAARPGDRAARMARGTSGPSGPTADPPGSPTRGRARPAG